MQQPFFVGQPMSPQMQPMQPMGVPQMMTQDGQMMMTMLPNGMLVPTAQLGFPADLEGQKKAAPDGVDMGEVWCPFTRGVREIKRLRCTAFVSQAFCGTCCVGIGVLHVTGAGATAASPCSRQILTISCEHSLRRAKLWRANRSTPSPWASSLLSRS